MEIAAQINDLLFQDAVIVACAQAMVDFQNINIAGLSLLAADSEVVHRCGRLTFLFLSSNCQKNRHVTPICLFVFIFEVSHSKTVPNRSGGLADKIRYCKYGRRSTGRFS